MMEFTFTCVLLTFVVFSFHARSFFCAYMLVIDLHIQRLLHASARTARADVLALPVANRPPPPPQIGTGSMGPPGSEELEIDIDMSTLDLRLKRLTNLPWDPSVRSAQLQRRKPHRPPTPAPLCLHAG